MFKIQEIKDYGPEPVKKLRKLEKLSKQKGRHNSHIHFNLQCKHTNITPRTIRINYQCDSTEEKSIIARAEKALLNIRIAATYKRRETIK